MNRLTTPLAPAVSAPTGLLIARDILGLRSQVAQWKKAGLTIGFVPTMGALHDGHLALVHHAKTLCDKVVVSIFINPMQFAPTEDLERYPRQETKDVAMLADAGCDLCYLPTPEIIYPSDFVTVVHVGGPALGLETDFRPQFFDGVTTVVCKLFNQVMPDVAVFGEKDYQQLTVIKTFVRDLNMPVDVIGLATVREADGLALSSRNAYLSNTERQCAIALFRALNSVKAAALMNTNIDVAVTAAKADLTAAGFGKIDYIALRDAKTLGDPVAGQPQRVLGAAWLGKTRLIDNIAV